jgi:hypothetical protein
MKTLIQHCSKYTLLLFLAFSACSEDELKVVQEDPFLELETERLNQDEYDFVLKLLKVDSDMSNTWSTFNLIRSHPIYVVTGENEGFFINPPVSEWPNSRIIDVEHEGFESLSLYRNNDLLSYAKSLTSANVFYRFRVYNGFDIFIYNISNEVGSYFYSQYKNKNGHYFVSVFFHELFHHYQLSTVFDQWWDLDFNISIFEYPLNSETLPYQILYFNVLIDAYNANNTTAEKTKILSYYVSINNKLLSLDTTDDNLIRNSGFALEKLEGVTRYVEVFSTLDALDNNTIEDPTHGFKEYVDSLNTIGSVRNIYGRRMFYHTGAGAIYLLKELGYPDIENDMLMPANTPFDLANSFLNMNAQEMENAIEEAKIIYDWDAILLRSQELLD